MKAKKMLISIALIVVMLLNCIAPVLQVQAATEKTTLTFNRTLYRGLKSYFTERKIKAVYNDGLHTIKMENNVIANIKELSLKEKGIKDITGLDSFTGVERLILSGNELDEKSNLSILNNFENLNYLDISSNQISDVSEIQPLVERLISLDSNAINLTGQVVRKVVDVSLNSQEEKTKVSYDLPQILQIAGIAQEGTIKNKGSIKADWVSHDRYYQAQNGAAGQPTIIDSTIPSIVTEANKSFDIKVGNETSDGFTQFQGLIKLVIKIKDVSTTSYTYNPASENILKDSIFTLYYAVHSDEFEGVIFEDNNFYNAVKEQLTKDQIINDDLLSYKYTTYEGGDKYYDVCDVSLAGTTATLKIDGRTLYTIENFNAAGNDRNTIIYDSTGSYYPIQEYTTEYKDIYDAEGVLTRILKVKVPHYNSDARNLYQDYYDEPYVLIIDKSDIINKITSLILNDKRIMDLSGLEKFVGLDSNLNISYNYIDTLLNVYKLQMNKEAESSNLKDRFNSALTLMETRKSLVSSKYTEINAKIEEVKKKIAEIEEAIEEANSLDSSAENYAENLKKCADKVKAANKEIEGDGTDDKPGLINEIETLLNDSTRGLNVNLRALNRRLANMYEIFNKEYKLTSLLTKELNYETEIEYEELENSMSTLEGAKSLVAAEISKISSLESADALSTLEKDLIVQAFRITIDADKDNPISEGLQAYQTYLEEEGARRSEWVAVLNKFIEIDIYAQAENYCLLERMNNNAAYGMCYVEEYLSKKIEELDYEGLNTDLYTAIYEKLTTGMTGLSLDENLYNIFDEYRNKELTVVTSWGREEYYRPCKGEYCEVNKLSKRIDTRRVNLGEDITYVSGIELYENVIDSYGIEYRNLSEETLYFYNQLMNLANKFTVNKGDIDRFVKLPELKKLDVRNNEIETLGNISVTTTDEEGHEVATEANLEILKNLKEFYAGHNFVSGDITCVNWANMLPLRKLDLSYNFITDIQPLQVLTYLKYLNVSDNLLSGAFNITLKAMPKLKDIILAGNQYEDISQILTDYEMDAGGDFTTYFASEDTLNIDLSRQKLEIDLTDKPIAYNSEASVYEIELPPIFAQLEFIDATRTAYGTTSSKGTITAKGGIAYVPIMNTGDYEGKVKVIAANGYPEDVTTSIGIDTECTIKYNVLNIRVDSVTINEEDVTRIEKGKTAQFTATVNGENVPDSTVEWSIDGNVSENTTITPDGLLTVAVDEESDEITITATSNYDDTIEKSQIIELYTKEVTGVTVAGEDSVKLGKTAQFTATVEGNNLEEEDKGVVWTVEGKESENTTITEDGVLTVGRDETAESITVKATSVFDNEKSGTKTIAVDKKEVVSVEITGNTVANPGKTTTYVATVVGNRLEEEDKGVVWTVEGKESENTTITEGGVLTVGEDETAESITVKATSKLDDNISGVKTVTISKKEVSSVAINEKNTAVKVGKTAQFTATVEGNNLEEEDKGVVWTVEGKNSGNTGITQEGLLTVGEDETAESITVKATSKVNESKYDTSVVRVSKTEVIPDFGYTVDNENDIVGVSPDTSSRSFKERLVSDNTYTLIVKREGREIADTDSVATGDIVVISKDGNILDSHEIVVKGDANGDGTVDVSDTILLKAHRSGQISLTGLFFKAADVNNDKTIDVSDIRLILAHRAKMEGYIL